MLEGQRSEHVLFYGLFGYKEIHVHRSHLSHSMRPADALFEHCRVPGEIDIHHGIGCLKVQTGRTGVCGKKEPAGGIRIELLYKSAPLCLRDTAVETNVSKIVFA